MSVQILCKCENGMNIILKLFLSLAKSFYDILRKYEKV
jgi:hypothetical protein